MCIQINLSIYLCCCRLLWNVEPRSVEIYPADGSVIGSIAHSEHHYVHYWFDSSIGQVCAKYSQLLHAHVLPSVL